MKSKSRWLLLLPILSLSASSIVIGCASGRFNHPSLAARQAPSAELILLRRSELAGGAFAFTVELNGEKLAKLRTGTYAEFRLVPGAYQLHFDGFQAIPPATFDNLKLAAGTRTYVMFGQYDIAWGAHASFSTAGPSSSGITATPLMGFNVMPDEPALELMRSYKQVVE